MNLIQIQEHLKDMPTQAIMGYANGQNPMVPPYLALSEMNRRKQMEKRAAEPPKGSVKEQLEQELMQPMPQVMPQPPQAGPQGAPQGMPQGAPQEMPQGMPQEMPQMPPQGMAGGGLTNLPMRSERFNYAPGGIVAFADGDLVQLPEQEAADIMTKQLRGESDIPMPVSREDERAALMAKDPAMAAYLNKAPGAAMTGLMGQLQAQNVAQKQQFQEQQSSQGLGTLANALMNAAEGTRGRKGSGIGEAFLGFGRTYTAAQAADYKRQQEQAAIERAQTIEMAKLQSDVDNMQRAFAEGRIDDGMKYKAAVEARKGKIAELQGLRAKDVMSVADTRRQREEQARHNKEQETSSRIQANAAAQRASFEREDRPTAEDKKLTKVMTALNNDPQYRTMLKRQSEFNPADPEFEAIQDVLDSIRNAAFADAKLTPPTARERLKSVAKPEDKRSFFDKLFGKTDTSTTPALPPGFVQVK